MLALRFDTADDSVLFLCHPTPSSSCFTDFSWTIPFTVPSFFSIDSVIFPLIDVSSELAVPIFFFYLRFFRADCSEFVFFLLFFFTPSTVSFFLRSAIPSIFWCCFILSKILPFFCQFFSVAYGISGAWNNWFFYKKQRFLILKLLMQCWFAY